MIKYMRPGGDAENTRMENTAPENAVRNWTNSREWKTWDKYAGLENVAVENAGVENVGIKIYGKH